MQRRASPTGAIGGALALATTLVGLVMAWPWEPAILFLLLFLPSVAGGGIARLRPDDPRALVLAALLVLAQAWLFLIGGFGLVYLAPVALLLHGAARTQGPNADRPQKRGVSV